MAQRLIQLHRHESPLRNRVLAITVNLGPLPNVCPWILAIKRLVFGPFECNKYLVPTRSILVHWNRGILALDEDRLFPMTLNPPT